MSYIEYLRKEMNMTVFLTTHYMEEAAKAQHICIIDSGKIIAHDTPFKLKEIYASDQLIVETSNKEAVEEILKVNHLNYKEDTNRLNIVIPNSVYSIRILRELEQYIKSFEVIQGTMENAFINATGKKMREE